MYVEDLFKLIDEVLNLTRLSLIIILIVFFACVFSITLFTMYMAARERANKGLIEGGQRTRIFSLLYICVSPLMTLGLIRSLSDHDIDLLLVVSISLYIVILTLTCIWFKGFLTFPFVLSFFTSSLLFAFFFSSKVMLNGIEAAETTVDTLQIYHEGHFQFSRHASWYDLAPIDAIMKVFLLYVLGINNPYDPTITTLIYSTLSTSILIFTFAFVKNFHGGFIRNCALAILLLSINPYSLLIEMSTPPTNFSLVFSMFAIMLASKRINNISGSIVDHTLIVSFILLTTSAVLAHPMSIMIPAYLLASLMYLVTSHANSKLTKAIRFLTLISITIFLSKLIYTGALYGASQLVDIIIEGFTTLLIGEGPKDISVYLGGPSPPKSTLFSFAAFPGFIAAVFFAEATRMLRGKRGDKLSVLILGVTLAFAAMAVVTNLATPSSRYLGYPAIVLASYQCMIYLANMPVRSKWKSMLIILLGIMCLSSVLSPNAMIEQYNVFTGGRWPREENFILSRFLINHVSLEYVASVFNGWENARLNLYFTCDILYYGYPYHHINVLLTERFLIPRLINARSYWDFAGRLFVKYSGYVYSIDLLNDNVVFNGWKWIMTWR